MSKKINAIPVNELADILNMHKSTLKSWLCHYSLTKYYFQMLTEKGGVENMFTINKSSIAALRKYLSHKRIKYLTYLDAGMDKIKCYYDLPISKAL